MYIYDSEYRENMFKGILNVNKRSLLPSENNSNFKL